MQKSEINRSDKHNTLLTLPKERVTCIMGVIKLGDCRVTEDDEAEREVRAAAAAARQTLPGPPVLAALLPEPGVHLHPLPHRRTQRQLRGPGEWPSFPLYATRDSKH